jgi:hypothetical protein
LGVYQFAPSTHAMPRHFDMNQDDSNLQSSVIESDSGGISNNIPRKRRLSRHEQNQKKKQSKQRFNQLSDVGMTKETLRGQNHKNSTHTNKLGRSHSSLNSQNIELSMSRKVVEHISGKKRNRTQNADVNEQHDDIPLVYQEEMKKYSSDDISLAFFELANSSKVGYQINTKPMNSDSDKGDCNQLLILNQDKSACGQVSEYGVLMANSSIFEETFKLCSHVRHFKFLYFPCNTTTILCSLFSTLVESYGRRLIYYCNTS